MDPQVHVTGTIGIEGDVFPVGRPCAAAVLASRGDDLLRLACGSSFGRERQAPEVGVLSKGRIREPLPIRRYRNLHILSGAARQLARPSPHLIFTIDFHTPQVHTAAAIGWETDAAPLPRPDPVCVPVIV